MGISTEGVLMFVHVTAVIVGLMLAAVLHTALLMTRRARTTDECRPWVPIVGRVEPLLPLAALVILGSGAWLIHLSGGEVSWSEGWIVVSLVTFVLIEAAGGSLAPRSKAWRAKMAEAAPGPVPDDVRRAGLDPSFWYVAHGGTAGFLAVVFLMSAKPTAGWSIVITVAAVAAGVGTAVPFVRPRPIITLPEPRSDAEARTGQRAPDAGTQR